jgi:hypothetical protein
MRVFQANVLHIMFKALIWILIFCNLLIRLHQKFLKIHKIVCLSLRNVRTSKHIHDVTLIIFASVASGQNHGAQSYNLYDIDMNIKEHGNHTAYHIFYKR